MTQTPGPTGPLLARDRAPGHRAAARRPARHPRRQPSPTRSCSRAERDHGIVAGLVRRRRASVQRSGDRPRRRRAARQRARRAAPSARCAGLVIAADDASPIGHYVGVLAPARRGAARPHRRDPAEAMRDGTLERDLPQVGRLERRPAGAVRARLLARRAACGPRDRPATAGRAGAGARAWESGAALPAVAPARGGRHASCSRASRWRWPSRSASLIASGRVYGGRVAAGGAHRLRRAHARHADPAAAVRALLRPRRGRPAAGVRRGAPRARRSTTRPTRARSTAARSRRCPTGQLEAARTLGFSERQVLRLVRGPQAFRLALAPMTNDFVALLKDSSLVSVLTVVELTKQTQIFATNLGSWVMPGALCAALYLAMSLPLARGWRGGSSAAGRRRPHERPSCLDVRGVHAAARRARGAARASTSTSARGELVALMGPSGAGKTTILRAVAGLEPFDAGRIDVDGVALDARAAPPGVDAAGAAAQGRDGVPVPLPVRAPDRAAQRLAGAGARARRRRGRGRAPRAELLEQLGVDAPRARAAARAVGRRGAARGDRARAGGRSAAAADGRADRVARPGAPRRAGRYAASASRSRAARCWSRRTTTTSRATSRTA